ncbi:36527_t:CDS:2 [Gigaspora margarita]|uniref:36527_t:CDS:1 n=1 Tax=Gigaspora margarita TaxID=4874 RepID=A0ABM8W1M0_GIGMA|nr:36527_t:CDS:2 [Gigaspora margarita]
MYYFFSNNNQCYTWKTGSPMDAKISPEVHRCAIELVYRSDTPPFSN